MVLAPTTVKPTPGPGEDAISRERVRELFWNDLRFISAINVLGLPSAVVPVTLHKGRPIGVQLIAGRYREDLALDQGGRIGVPPSYPLQEVRLALDTIPINRWIAK